MSDPHYQVYAVKYARFDRHSSGNFMGGDPHDGPMPLYFFVWLIRGHGRTILVDTGFNADRAAKRGRALERCPIEALASLGVAPGDVDTVVITHLHYDHAGNMDKLPNARFVLQEAEMNYATGRYMRHRMVRHPFELGDVQLMVALNYAERVDWVNGVSEIAPGVTVHHLPGHSLGLQAVTVETDVGRICLASDVAHFYANVEHGLPFPITASVVDQLDGHEAARKLASHPDLMIPGHDPLVTERFAALADDPEIYDLTRPLPRG
ncbi:N-acyl homoserine lactonase family protein [Pseudooceanicola sp.]|uniref:N-acyl homoserine lactonase family protein n=1 Tax=Pseudooceanicola sp. TaxID=1914328 RepID=UPI0026287540|nr:N-acyl homoserine lactonase family protein [Pseudooceanicola sp.]MDF1856185.1 N-acyl homoserine lactonase family protein [Pseudooceanicola sp.]